MKILIVDDDPEITTLLSLIMRHVGYTAIECNDATRAYELCERERPDCILLDLMMPGIDGWKLLETFQSASDLRDIPVVIITGNVNADRDYLLEQGVKGFVIKPFDPHTLLSLIDRLLLDVETEAAAAKAAEAH
ncbi:MAG: response regulator [Candidatus Geothermincolia bacterium]